MQALESLPIWSNPAVKERLGWYFQVSTNHRPAKYLICRRISCELDLSSDEKELWKEHDKLTERFLVTHRAIRNGEANLGEFPKAYPSFMDLKVELVKRMLTHCNFCRWNCKVDRSKGVKHGTCQLENDSRVGSYFHHRGEELPIRGNNGSGTIFFTSCNLRCQFCQNGDISHDKMNGITVTPEQIAFMMWQLRMEGTHNINLVGGEPTIHLHNIVAAIGLLDFTKPGDDDLRSISEAKADAYYHHFRARIDNAYHDGEFNVPILWNSNFFMSEETVKILRTLMDIWLPDFKFGSNKCSIELSLTPWYFETCSRNHKLVYDWGEDMVIRHLIMPQHVECCTKPVLEWIAKNTPKALVNVMDQFHPDYACDPCSPKYNPRYQYLSRECYTDEVIGAYKYAKDLGLCFEPLSYERSVFGLRA